MIIKITKFLQGIFIVYLQIIWFIIAIFALPLFCIARGLNKILDCINEYENDFIKQYNE